MAIVLPVTGSLNWDVTLDAALTALDGAVTQLQSTALIAGTAVGGDLTGTLPGPSVTSTHLTAPLPVNQGGTGSATQNYVDLTTAQTVAGVKTFSSLVNANAGISSVGALTTTVARSSSVTGDAQARFNQTADGTLNWGTGAATPDVNLYRGGANQLNTDDTLVSGQSIRATNNVVVGSNNTLGDNGVGEVQFANATTVPTTNPTAGVVVYSQAGVLKLRNPQGLVITESGAVQSTTATTTIANSAVLTALETFTVPAGDAVAGAIYEMTGYGTFSVTGTPTLAFTLYWGGIAGTPIATVPVVTAASGITNAPFMFRAIVHFRSTTSATAVIHLNVDSSATTDASSSFVATPTAANTGLSTAAAALTMGFTWSAASASNTISLLGGDVRRIA